MDITRWKKGMYARVKPCLKKTYQRHGESDEMENMKGGKYKIEKVFKEKGRLAIILEYNEYNSFYFDAEDLILLGGKKIPLPEPVLFDPHQLVI